MERNIFRYRRGGKDAFGDPLAIRRRLTALLDGDPDATLTASRSPEPSVAFPAVERLRAAVCATFDLGKPFDPETGEGVMEEEWLEVLNGYTEWLEKNARTAGNLPTSSTPSAAASSAGPSTTPNTPASS